MFQVFISIILHLLLKLGYAITSHSSQGLTIKDDLCIHEISKMIYVDTSILYTAITRASKYPKLHLYNKPNEEEEAFKFTILPKLEDDEENFEFGQALKSA